VGKFIDLSGQRFGMLVVTSKRSAGKNTLWNYICDCGSEGASTTARLNHGQNSCGCHTRDKIGERSYVHGHTVDRQMSPTYRTYRAMISRCIYPSQEHYHDYGGRGISVCDRWMNGDGVVTGFECFLSDMGEKPRGLTIDRIDNDGNYEPGNCKWATQKEQMSHTRASKFSPADREKVVRLFGSGVNKCAIARETGMSRWYVRDVLKSAANDNQPQSLAS